jgi:hypothetical protein
MSAAIRRGAALLGNLATERRPGSFRNNLFDHLVGIGEQWRRHVEAERLGGSQIDDEIEFGRLLYRQISRFGTSQYPVNIRDNWPTEIGSTKLDKNEADKRRL